MGLRVAMQKQYRGGGKTLGMTLFLALGSYWLQPDSPVQTNTAALDLKGAEVIKHTQIVPCEDLFFKK